MLENVFIELYERGILLFLDVNSYCKNSDDADLNILKGRKEFLKYFDEPLEKRICLYIQYRLSINYIKKLKKIRAQL